MIEVLFYLFIGVGGSLTPNEPYVDSYPTKEACEARIAAQIPGVNAPADAAVACIGPIKAQVKPLVAK